MAAYEFPVNVCKINIEGEDKLRTSASYIRTVLADEGVQVQDFIIEDDEEQQISTLGGVSMALASACAKLKDSGIYEKVIMDIDKAEYSDSTTSDVGQVQVNIKLEEKKWYKIYIGAGVKQQGSGIIMNESSQLGALPMAQFEASASLSNIRGCTDTTNISYTLDQTSTPTFFVSHDTPATVEIDDMQHSSIRLLVDTMDFEHARSYKEFQRSFSYRLSNARAFSPMLMEGIWKSLEWNAVWRDLLPCRFPNAPFACDASPHVIAEAGPSLKHSLSFDYKLNGAYLDNRLAPTRGFDFSSTTEFAGPPGDVGFFKMNKFLSFHLPLNFLGLSLHTSLSTGFVRSINFGGTCNRVTPISDRFFVGGPLHLRGFEAAGIGPRADSVRRRESKSYEYFSNFSFVYFYFK